MDARTRGRPPHRALTRVRADDRAATTYIPSKLFDSGCMTDDVSVLMMPELMPSDDPGFWEQNGYNLHGDPWAEERYW